MWLDLTMTHRQTWLFTLAPHQHNWKPLETFGGVLSTVDMVVQRRDGPRRLRDNDDVSRWWRSQFEQRISAQRIV